MKIGMLGTGMVGQTVGAKLVELGHEVRMGSRSTDHEGAAEWVEACGEAASQGTFADAAAFGELIFNCTAGAHSLEALEAAGADNLADKVLVDIANPLVFEGEGPPTLAVSNDDSLGEQIQRAFPETRVVKTLNTVNCEVMVDPGRLAEPTDIFVCGDDASAKETAVEILEDWFGWERVTDLGDITNARATESILPIWVRLWGALGTPDFNFKIVTAE